jgi:hypothetical protein
VCPESLQLATNRYLTLHQLEDVIEEVYKGKAVCPFLTVLPLLLLRKTMPC